MTTQPLKKRAAQLSTILHRGAMGDCASPVENSPLPTGPQFNDVLSKIVLHSTMQAIQRLQLAAGSVTVAYMNDVCCHVHCIKVCRASEITDHNQWIQR